MNLIRAGTHDWKVKLALMALLAAACARTQAGPPERFHERRREHHGPVLYERGHVVHELPLGCRVVDIRGNRYFERGGVYFKAAPQGYVIVDPPEAGVVVTPSIGSIIATLPLGAVTVTIGGTPYYRHGNVFYRSHTGGYVVVQQPPSAVIVESQPAPPQVISHPPTQPATDYQSVWIGDQEYLARDGLFYRKTPEGLKKVDAPIGVVLSAPPAGSLNVWIGDKEYFYFDSTFFQKRPNGYEVVPPPPNAYIRALPKAAKTIWTSGRKLYYLDGNFYEQKDEGFLITSAPVVFTPPSVPVGSIVPAPPEGSVEFWVNDVEYLYSTGNFYRKQPAGYRVVNSPL